MDYNLSQNVEYCRVIVEEFSGLLYYSHIPTAGIALLIGIFVYFNSNKSLISGILLSISTTFAFWCILDLAIWMNYDKASIVMAAWAPIELLSILIFVFCLYFVHVFIDKKDVDWWMKFLWIAMILPIVVAIPTNYNLELYDIQECIAWENSYYQDYYRTLKFLFSGWIVFTLVYKYYKISKEFKKQILFLGLGILIFLIGFFVAGYISDKTLDYTYEMYGLFAMVAFMVSLAYLIVRFKAFNLKVIGAQALILSLIILIGSQFAFIQTNTNRVLTAVTLIITGFIGINLIRSVKREVALREQLETANEGQAQLIHFINHQIKGYLNKARIVFSEVLTGKEYEPVSQSAKDMLTQGESNVKEGVDFVQQILKASDIEKGTFTYEMTPIDLKEILEAESEGKRSLAESKGLAYSVEFKQGDYKTKGDVNQLREAIKNLIENSVNYTLKGSIHIQLSKVNNKILLKIEDTGVGLSNEVKSKLFTKGGRDKDSLKINVNSTGFGLSIVKSIVEAHKGRVWAESPGVNQGSTFYLELPVS